MKTTTTLLRAGIALLFAAESLLAGAPVKPSPPIVQIYLVDRSGSIGEFKPPETMQPALLHCVNLAELSQQPVSIAVIFFGAGGVHVVGDEHGMPTAAYATLRHELTTKWPKPDGETPMDAAFATAVKMVHALAPRRAGHRGADERWGTLVGPAAAGGFSGNRRRDEAPTRSHHQEVSGVPPGYRPALRPRPRTGLGNPRYGRVPPTLWQAGPGRVPADLGTRRRHWRRTRSAS